MLNVAILAAGIGLLSASDIPAVVPIVVLLVGAAMAVLAMLASKTQHDYYKNVRDLKEELEQRLGLGRLVLRTTRGMGGLAGASQSSQHSSSPSSPSSSSPTSPLLVPR